MLYVLIGPSASGKSTMARMMATHLDNAIVVNRDSLREMMFGYTEETINEYYKRSNLGSLEQFVSEQQDRIIQGALAAGKDVIVDNTHLRLKYINDLKKYNEPMIFTLVEVEFDAALLRDSRRTRQVGESVLRRQYAELDELKKVFEFKAWFPGLDEVKEKIYGTPV